MPGLSGLGVPDRAQQSRGRETHDKYQACVKRDQQGRTHAALAVLCVADSLAKFGIERREKGLPWFCAYFVASTFDPFDC